jgi:hypothetical protein
MTLLTIFQQYQGGQFYCSMKLQYANLPQITDKSLSALLLDETAIHQSAANQRQVATSFIGR